MTKAPKLLAITAGGHATMPPGKKSVSIPKQEAYLYKTTEKILHAIRDLVKEAYKLRFFSHGSGPQTGIVMERGERSAQQGPNGEEAMHELPLRYASMNLIATLGMTFQLAIDNACQEKGIEACLGQDTKGVSVNPTSFIIDPKTLEPVKPIGKGLSVEQVAAKRAAGHTVEKLDDKGHRILVPSPKLVETHSFDLETVAALIRAEILPIAGGTGGRALKQAASGLLEAIDAVIDKDRALVRMLVDLSLKQDIQFDTAAFVTDARYIVRDFGIVQRAIDRVSEGEEIDPADLAGAYEKAGPIYKVALADMQEQLERGRAEGTITGGAVPKLEAACDLLEQGGAKRAIICNTDTLEPSLNNNPKSGTIIELGARWV